MMRLLQRAKTEPGSTQHVREACNRNRQHAICYNVACNLNDATTARNMQHATYALRRQRARCNRRNATGNMQHAARDTQQETRRSAKAGYAEHETLNMQHAT
jgi:hypothetical protein